MKLRHFVVLGAVAISALSFAGSAEAGWRDRVVVIAMPDGTIVYEVHRLRRPMLRDWAEDSGFIDELPVRPPGMVRGARYEEELLPDEPMRDIVPSIAPKKKAVKKKVAKTKQVVATTQVPVPRPKLETDVRAPEIEAAEKAIKDMRLDRADGIDRSIPASAAKRPANEYDAL